jgi:hypothetical protein
VIWIAVLQVVRAVGDAVASARQRVRRAVGYPRSLLPPFDDEGEEPIPLTWRDVELRELGLDVGRERQRQRQRELRGQPDPDATPTDTDAPDACPAPAPPPLPAVSAVPTLRPLPSGMPTRTTRPPGR